jgi:hypothetical protein
MTILQVPATSRFPALVGAVALTALTPLTTWAEEEKAKTDPHADRLNFALFLNLDSFFGANPAMFGSYEIDDGSSLGYGLDLTFYGIQWGVGTGSAWGQWTEAGVGLNFDVFDGALAINPQLGFTFGSLLSSGAAQDGIIGDGIVPNMTINLNTERFRGQAYAGFYQALRDNSAPLPLGMPGTTNNYIHWWTFLGYRLNSIFTAGVHAEELFLSGGSNIPDAIDGYFWVGPYLEVSKDNAGIRLAFGDDLTHDANSFSVNDFYKLQFFFNF